MIRYRVPGLRLEYIQRCIQQASLTEAKVRTCRSGDHAWCQGAGSGLYLRIRKGDAKVGVSRHNQHGKTRVITPGDYPLPANIDPLVRIPASLCSGGRQLSHGK